MNPKFKDAWTATQRVELLFFRAAAYSNLDRFRKLFDGFEIEGEACGALIRMGCGLNYQKLAAENYLRRYHFSSN